MAKTPDGRRVYICPTCSGARQVAKRVAGKKGSEVVMEDCRTCDGSGQIVGEPT